MSNGILHSVEIEEIQLDVCKQGCGGIWFDRLELQKMDEPHEFTDENLLEVLAVARPDSYVAGQRRNCPNCPDTVMMRHFFSVKREVEVDHCPRCAGYWLDEGELFKIRQQSSSEEQRRQAAVDSFAEVFNHDLEAMRQEKPGKGQRGLEGRLHVQAHLPQFLLRQDQELVCLRSIPASFRPIARFEGGPAARPPPGGPFHPLCPSCHEASCLCLGNDEAIFPRGVAATPEQSRARMLA